MLISPKIAVELCTGLPKAIEHNAINVGKASFLSADAYLSTTGSGQGLKRIMAIAEKYDGTALFRFEEKGCLFSTNITIILPDPKTL